MRPNARELKDSVDTTTSVLPASAEAGFVCLAGYYHWIPSIPLLRTAAFFEIMTIWHLVYASIFFLL